MARASGSYPLCPEFKSLSRHQKKDFRKGVLLFCIRFCVLGFSATFVPWLWAVGRGLWALKGALVQANRSSRTVGTQGDCETPCKARRHKIEIVAARRHLNLITHPSSLITFIPNRRKIILPQTKNLCIIGKAKFFFLNGGKKKWQKLITKEQSRM